MSKDIGLEKISFMGYSTRECNESDLVGQSVAQINPSSFTRKLTVNVPDGKDGSDQATFAAETYSFDLLFDGTGAIDDSTGQSSIGDTQLGIGVEIDDFLCAVYRSDDQTPTYVKMYYCGMEYRCMLTSMSINYSLFHRNGAPMRAKLTCSFKSFDIPKEAEKSVTLSDDGLAATIKKYKYSDCDGNVAMMLAQAMASGADSLL